MLIDCHGRCGMWNKEEANAMVKTLCLNHLFYFGSDVYEFRLGAGFDRQGLVQGASSEKKRLYPRVKPLFRTS